MAEKLTIAQQCDQIQARVHARTDNPRDPAEFVDFQKCVRDRDATISELALAVDTLCRIVTELDSRIKD